MSAERVVGNEEGREMVKDSKERKRRGTEKEKEMRGREWVIESCQVVLKVLSDA